MPILRVTEKEMKCACFNYLHLFVPTNNETVNLVLLQKHDQLVLKNNTTLFY